MADAEQTLRIARAAQGQDAKTTQSGRLLLIIFGVFVGLILLAILADEINRRADPKGHAARHAASDALRKADEAKRLARDKAAADQDQVQKAAAVAKQQADANAAAQTKAQGMHCLSGWDGSNRDAVEKLKQNLRNPSSFEHIETKIAPEKNGKHILIMKYRAENGFGGMNVESLVATVDNETCNSEIVTTGR